MGERLIKPYEISVWEDKLTQDGLKETKLAVIGSDTMTGPNKVYEPVFTKKVNGEKTLTFSLKYKYFDPYSGNEDVINPFAALLVNERKVKLKYDDQWYEFIVKDHTESSEEYTWTYTCIDAFVLELSKNGYNIEFNTELNNNQGTALELATAALENTDWQVSADNFKQLIAEPIYKATLKSISGIELINANDSSAAGSIQADTPIYLFYSYVKNKNGKFVQFILQDEQYVVDDKNVITAINYRINTELVYDTRTIEINNESQDVSGFWLKNEETYTLIISIDEIETLYQANRLAYAQKTTYDPIMQRTVDCFKANDREIYRYVNDVYTTSNVVMNYMANGDNFNSLEEGTLQGWNPYVDSEDNDAINQLELITYPELEDGKPLADLEKLSQIEGFLKVKFIGAVTNDYLNTIFNDGIQGNTSFINSISQGDEFVFRWRAGKGEFGNLQPVDTLGLLVAKYTRDTPQRWGRYYYHIDTDDIILDIKATQENPVQELNNIIEGGHIEDIIDEETQEVTSQIYVINDVAQAISTKYLYKENDTLYYWDGTKSQFKIYGTLIDGEIEVDPESTYVPYYYLTGKAQKAIPNSVLTDPTVKYGIFIYTTAVDTETYIDEDTEEIYTEVQPIYIQDIQFTRYLRDANEHPVIIGNIPTATITPTEYYYLKPSDGLAAEDIQTYTSVEDIADILNVEPDEIKAIYNEDSEKNLSISISQSNCFNILQTIAETFECWVDLVVNHDPETGYITFTNGKPDKYVYLREYAGKDNWAGFKYGINLNSIERNINSDEIVTKLIVDQSQSDYVDEGYVSIANSPSNPSGESYILNFDYYYSQGLLNREEVEEVKIQFIDEIKSINIDLQEAELKRRNLEASLIDLNSKRNVYSTWVEAAQNAQTEALEEFQELTNSEYEVYKDLYNRSLEEIDDSTEPDEPIEPVEPIEPIEDEDEEDEGETVEDIESLFNEENVLSVLGKLYTSSAIINNYSGILNNINTEYWKVRQELRGSENYEVKIWTGTDDLNARHVFVEVDDYLKDLSFVLGDNIQTYIVTLSQKYFDIITSETEITFTAPEGYTIETNSYIIDDNPIRFKVISTNDFQGIEDQIDELLKEKKELVNEFNNKYSRFIQEGTWNSTDYIDSELYYLDALQVSNTSAQPAVSYTINVVEVSELEDLSDYSFDAGDKTYVEDTEFFGWANKGGISTPAREEVIVSEVEWHLEEPENNVITVQNYKTRFEDLFQRINAAVQTVQYNEATYAKISSLMDANGTINQDVLVKSLQQIAGQQYNLTSDGSVIIDGDQILVRNLNNTQNYVIINSEGIQVTSNAGTTRVTAIDGYGINAGSVYTGELNTKKVIIGNSENPSFRWDKSGISAYKAVDNERYDLQTYVRYDQYGLYGIKEGGTFKAQSLQDVLDKAHFAVTWDGFFIKNSYEGGGKVSITSDNDFQVLQSGGNEKIKIGALEWKQVNWQEGDPIYTDPTTVPEDIRRLGPSLYGIRIKNNEGIEVMKTDDSGNITITGTINATGGNFNTIINVGPEDAGHIIIDGTEGANSPSISSSNYNDGASTGWIINKDGDAVFNNITARGAIKTAVFEYAEIQAVGGIFVFRPSSVIKSARISNNDNDLIVTVEKPLLFKKISYNQISNPASDSNPKTLGWYEKPAYGGYKLTDDIVVNSEKEYYVRVETANGSWCKISNYISDGTIADATIHNILKTNGLTHVYEVSDINSDGEITLAGAKAFVTAIKQAGQSDQDVLNALVGGALIDMGRTDGSSNYGIGINSSDNTVNLPARAISLFETTINTNSTNNLRVGYDIRGILGTLPFLNYTEDTPKVNELYHNNLEGTQGIYTDNMYIGNHNQYITFYSSRENGSKHLKINVQELTLKAGSFSRNIVDSRQDFVYLSNENYAKDIIDGIQINNSDIKTDWRLIIGNKFGVDKAGNLYAANAHIEGDIQATSGHFGSISYDGNTTTIPENAITGLTEKLNQISNEASLKGYTLHVETIYPDYPSEIIDGTPDNITLTAHVYYANRDITTSCDPNLFIWQLKNEEQIETLTPNIDNPYSVTYDRNLAGYGTTIICNFAIDEEVLLTTPDHFALETPDGFLLTARV